LVVFGFLGIKSFGRKAKFGEIKEWATKGDSSPLGVITIFRWWFK
jgi:hypothetical protein